MFDFPSAPTTGQTYTPAGGPTYVYNGYAWAVLSPGSNFATTIFTATAGQTTFSVSYTVGAIYVYRNGVLLAPADFTATNGTSVVLANACNLGDTVEIISLAQVPYVNCVQKTGDTMTGTLNLPANGLVVGTTQLVAASGNVGIGTATPTTKTHLLGAGSTSASFTGAGLGATLYLQDSAGSGGNGGQLLFGALQGSFAGIKGFLQNGTGPAGDLIFQTRGTSGDILERMRITQGGAVGINTATPGSALTVDGNLEGNNYYLRGSATTSALGVGFSNANGPLIAMFGTGSVGTGRLEFYTAGTQKGVFDNSGNFGIGTSAPGTKLDVGGSGSLLTARVINSDGFASRLTLANNNRTWSITNYGAQFSPNGSFQIADENAGSVRFSITTGGFVGINVTNPGYTLDAAGTGQFTRAGLTSYADCSVIATASSGNAGIAVHCAGSSAPILRNERGTGDQLDCVNSTQSGFGNFRAAAFTVVSDYRFKENLSPLSEAIERVKELNPIRFSFTENSMMWNEGKIVDGFLAHEVAAVVPEAVTGQKDAVKEDGTPLYQSLDQAKLVPLLTAALQEAISKIESLEARVAQLEGAK